jgi:hypothetical protein
MTGRRSVDPFARKMVYGSFVYGGVIVVMFAVLTVVYLHTRPGCSDRLLAESTSPDKRWVASLMERRCGEEAPFFAHVNLRPAGEEIQRGFFSGVSSQGEVFLVEQDAAGAGVSLIWTAPATLLVECPRCNLSFLRKQEARWKEVGINYKLSSR